MMLAALLLMWSATAARATAPHVSGGEDSDVCAMCHRVHSSASDAGWTARTPSGIETTGFALLAVPSTGAGDSHMCFSCHGIERLGSETDVQSAFTSASGHRLTPADSPFGPARKQCSSCHDSHGAERMDDGTPYPALLRVNRTGVAVMSGDALCAECHADTAEDTWDGLGVWDRTAHANAIAPPTSGTGIVCSACHDPHGSDSAPSIVSTLVQPSAPAAVSIAGNDRSLCLGCHASSRATWPGASAYASGSHARSEAAVPLTGEWPARSVPADQRLRPVGECQVCHAPMGRSDDDGGIVPSLLHEPGRAPCDGCHNADGPAETDMASRRFDATVARTEVVAVWRPAEQTARFGDVAVYVPGGHSPTPQDLIGPRVLRPSGKVGHAASGDLLGDGHAEVVMADPSGPYLDLLQSDPLAGLYRAVLEVPNGAAGHLVALADLFSAGAGPHGAQADRAEVVLVERNPVTLASTLHVYEFDGRVLTTRTGGGLDVGTDASGIAVGDLDGDGRPEIAVTAAEDDRLHVFSAAGGSVAEIDGSPFATLAGPRGLSIGKVFPEVEGEQIVVCNAGQPAGVDNVSVFSAGGALLGSYATSGYDDAGVAYDSAVGDVLDAHEGAEIVVALRCDPASAEITAMSSINVFRRPAGGGGFGPPERYATGVRFESSAVELGDVTGDGRNEVVVGNAGRWRRLIGGQAPSLQVFSATALGDVLEDTPHTLWATGVEQASGLEGGPDAATAPAVIVADLGPVGPSRHPVDADTRSHRTTETVPVAADERHVGCSDCHNAHEATATVSATAPAAYGAIRGVPGAEVTNTGPGPAVTLARKDRIEHEYELCFKCHSQDTGGRDIAAEVNPLNASVHAVQRPSENATGLADAFAPVVDGTFLNDTTAWTKDSVLYCVDCHTVADPALPRGPHVGDSGSLLRRPYWGVLPEDESGLCYMCHKYSVYFTGDDDTAGSGSHFRDATNPVDQRMHTVHVAEAGFSCRACHVSHGSATLPHLQGIGHAYEHTETGGACATACHTGGVRRTYSR